MYCPTDEIIGDFMTKPFQKKFWKFRKEIDYKELISFTPEGKDRSVFG